MRTIAMMKNASSSLWKIASSSRNISVYSFIETRTMTTRSYETPCGGGVLRQHQRRRYSSESSSSNNSGVHVPEQWLRFFQNNNNNSLFSSDDDDETWHRWYSKRGSSYDGDTRSLGYTAAQRAAEELDHQIRKFMVRTGKGYIDSDQNPLKDGHSHQRIKIADVGAGTGLVGEWLSRIGNNRYDLVGLDVHPGMLQVAAQTKPCYQEFHQVDMNHGDNATTDVDYAAGFLDAAICVDSMGLPGHITNPTTAIDNMMRMIRNPGGILCVTLRHQQEDNDGDDDSTTTTRGTTKSFIDRFRVLQDTGKLKLLNVTDPEPFSWIVPDVASFRTWTYMVVS